MSPHRTLFYAAALLAGTLAIAACKAVPLTAPNEATMNLQANPLSIPAVDGASTITATVFKAADDGGGTVADGTQIFFTSSLGIIEERVATVNGVARATLRSNGRAGQATVTATSGTLAAQTVTVEIGAGDTGELVITVVATPSVLGPFDFTSEIVATVTDNRGNPIANAPVIFSTTGGALASAGSVLRTNAQGQAFDRLTFSDDGTDSATVTATSGSSSGSTTVTRGTFDAPTIDFVSPSTGSGGSVLTITIGGQNYQAGATVSFGTGIEIRQVTFVNSETLLVDITINPGATPGGRTVTVTNPDGNSGSLTDAFTVNGTAPSCSFTATSSLGTSGGTGTAGDPIRLDSTLALFDASASSDPDGTIVSFDWDFGDGTLGSGQAVSHDYAPTTAPGDVLQVVLTATDDDAESCVLVKFVEVP